MNVISRGSLRWKSLIISILAVLLLAACSTLTMEVETPEGQPAVRTQMEATDPVTVNLASGKPQLVEFFAFW
jgi:hypothetical protein